MSEISRATDYLRGIERQAGRVREVPAPAWTTYTPTVTSSAGTITAYTAAGQYRVIGKSCLALATVNITTAGTGGGILQVSLPIAPSSTDLIVGWGMTGVPVGLTVWIPAAGTVIYVMKYDGTGVIATGLKAYVGVEYKIA